MSTKPGLGSQKPLEWVTSLIARFEEQLPVKTGPLTNQSKLLVEHSQACLVNVSKQKFSMVVSGLVKTLQTVNSMRTCSEQDLFDSQCIILDTLEQCLVGPKDSSSRIDEASNVKLILQEMCQFLQQPNDSNQSIQLKDRASKVVYGLSIASFNTVFSKITYKLKSISNDMTSENSVNNSYDLADIELMQHIHLDLNALIKLLREICFHKPFKKETNIVLVLSLEKAVWNWMDTYPDQFRELQRVQNEELNECCERLFDQLEFYAAESTKRKASIWPLQMMLLILCPKILEEIHHAESGAPCSNKHLKKKLYFDSIKKALAGASHHTNKQQLTAAACVACVKLCKAATYVNVTDSANVFFALLHSVINDVKMLLFNSTKPIFRNNVSTQELDIMIDCFVALFRLNYNNEVFRTCLQAQTSSPLQIVLVNALYRIAVQPRLHWWPKIDLVYSRASELRNIFNETLNRVTQGASSIGLSSALSSSGHMPIKVTQSLQKVSQLTGKFRDKGGVGVSDETISPKQLLFGMIRLICTEPMLFLHERAGPRNEADAAEIHSSSSELINGLVSLLSFSQTMPEIVQEAMEALLCLHQPENIRLWNPESPSAAMQTFWYISSQLLFYICQKLLLHQLPNYPEIMRWLRHLLMYRNAYLMTNREIANFGSNEQLCKQASAKLETACFLYLWSLDNDAVLTAMSMFRLLSEEIEIRCAADELPLEYYVYAELASASNLQSAGRAALQKSVNSYLRRVKMPVHGCVQAWEDTFRYWDAFTKYLKSYAKSKPDETSQRVEILLRTLTQRKYYRTQEHEFEDVILLWANMTGFLCALGGVCLILQNPNETPYHKIGFSVESKWNLSSILAPSMSEQYCPVARFLNQLLSLLFVQSDKLDASIMRHIKEILSHELNCTLHPCLFEQIRLYTDKFFDSNGQVVLLANHTEFMEHVIYIMKNILLDLCYDKSVNSVKNTKLRAIVCIEPILMTLCRYTKFLESSAHTMTVKLKLCQLIEIMMKRRDYLTFRQEIRFRNKIVEHLIDWIIGNHPTQAACLHSPEMSAHIRELDFACMTAVSSLIAGLPLQPSDDADRDLMDVKSQMFQKYFSLFMNLLNDCSAYDTGSGFESETVSLKNATSLATGVAALDHSASGIPGAVLQSRRFVESKMEQLRCVTVEAMSNLLSANIDSGLVHSLGLGYHKDLRVRVAFAEVLIKILQRGTEFETLNETVLADRYQELVKLVTMITDEGDLPIAAALANVVQGAQLDELARVLVTLFDAKHLLHELLWKMFMKEVEFAESPNTLFRGNTLSSKIMGYCFKIYGSSYLNSLLRGFVAEMVDNNDRYYEVDPSRLEANENLDENIQNVLRLVDSVFDSILSSADRFPGQLRSMCHCLYQVVNARFPTTGLAAVSTIVFLRFINPAIVSPYEHCLMESVPSAQMKRGLMLVSKILQNIANQSTFIKEQWLMPFNSFIQSKFDAARRFFSEITLNVDGTVVRGHTISFLSEGQVNALHRLLWFHQDEISNYFTAARVHATLSRRLSTLLAQIGPPEHRPMEPQWSTLDWTNTTGKFEDIMSEYSIAEQDEYKSIKALSIFYQAGQSKQGNPVFYYVARRFKLGDVNGDVLIFHVFQLLSSCNKPFELVIDLTHAATENRFRTELLQKWIVRLSDIFYRNLVTVYIYNCNSWVREYTRFHERLLNQLKGSRKMVFLDNLMKLSEYIDFSQQRLPTTTLALDEDVRVFNNALKLWHKDIKCSIKIGLTAVQIVTLDRQKVLGHSIILNDIYYASELEESCLVDDNTITFTILNESSPLSIIHNECEQILSAIAHIKTCYEMSQPDQSLLHPKIRAKDVPGTLLNMALLNLGSTDPSLRTAAYNLLCALSVTFDFKIEGQLSETEGLLIPANNTIFIKSISEKLASNEPHLTLEFLEECIQGFGQSTIELKHLCLEYMTPWLANLPRFCKITGDETKKQKVCQILDKLIVMTIEEFEMYPSIQAKIWGNFGRVSELLDLILDGFIKKSIIGGLGSLQAEVLADTTVALAAANTSVVANNVVNRLMNLLEKTCCNPQSCLEEHVLWNDIAILARYLLLLSFNNCLDVVTHLPTLFHFVTVLVNTGPLSLRASVHGLVINIIHSLCTCTSPMFSEETKNVLRLALTEFSLPKFYRLFGISQLTVKSVAATAFRVSPRLPLSVHPSVDYSIAVSIGVRDDYLTLPNLETITDALIELLEACNQDILGRNLVYELTQIARNFALRFNPALQPRALVVFSCLSKNTDEMTVKQLLTLLVQFVKRRDDIQLISAGLMALTRLQPLLAQDSSVHETLFWVAIIVLQLEDAQMYEHGLALLEQNLRTLDSHGIFEFEKLEKVTMEVRKPLEWEFKALDQQVGLSFKHNFNFALVAYLLKGLRHPSTAVVNRTVRILYHLLSIVAKATKRDKFEVSVDSVAYLTALLSVSDEVRLRCHLHSSTIKALSMCGSSENLNLTMSSAAYDDRQSDSVDFQVESEEDQLTMSRKVPPPPSPYAFDNSFLTPNMDTLCSLSVQMPKPGKSMTKQRSWTSQAGANFERDYSYVPKSVVSRTVAHRSNSVPLSPTGSTDSAKFAAAVNNGAPSSKTSAPASSARTASEYGRPPSSLRKRESGDLAGRRIAGAATLPASTSDGAPRRRLTSSGGGSVRRRQQPPVVVSAVQQHAVESNVLLDASVLNEPNLQALVLTVLATLVRNATDEKETRVLFEYLAEASVVFPKVFPVVHSLLDQHITKVLEKSHDSGVLRAVLHIVQNMVPGQETAPHQQHVTVLQGCGFGGLWRFAGPFLTKPAAQQAITAEVCTCLERLVSDLSDAAAPLTPPPPSPRISTVAVVAPTTAAVAAAADSTAPQRNAGRARRSFAMDDAATGGADVERF